MTEEVVVKLGMDAGPVRTALSGVRNEFNKFSDSSQREFVKAGSAARGFKGLLHEVSSESPLMGTALRFALSPIVGMFAAATLAATYFKGKIDELNSASEAFGKGISDPITHVKDNLREAQRSLAEFRYEQEKWLKDLTANDNTINKQLADRLVLLNAQSKQLEKLSKAKGGGDAEALAIERQRLQIQLDLQTGAQRALGLKTMDLEGRRSVQLEDIELNINGGRPNRIKENNEAEAKEQERLAGIIDFKKKQAFDSGNVLIEGVKSLFTGAKGESVAQSRVNEINDLQTQLKASKDRVVKNNKILDDENLTRKKLTDTLSQTEAKLKDAHDAQQQLARDITATTRDLSYLPGSGGTNDPGQFDWGAYAAENERKRLDANLKNDMGYRIAHMNDAKNALGTKPITLESLSADIKQQLIDLNTKIANGVPVFGKEQ